MRGSEEVDLRRWGELALKLEKFEKSNKLEKLEKVNKVPHQRLLAKVRACGVAGQVANWIVNWLRGRKQ